MHTYSIDTEERKTIIFFIAIISMMINSVFICIINQYSCLSFIKVPSPFVIFGVLYLLFDKIIWKWKICFLFVKTPNLNGQWQGQYESSYQNMVIPATLKIKQSWTKIEIVSQNGDTQSNSSMAGIFTNGGGEISLKFEYCNNSNLCMKDQRPSHSGFNHLIYNKEEKVLFGSYYTDKNRGTYGNAYFKYVTKK